MNSPHAVTRKSHSFLIDSPVPGNTFRIPANAIEDYPYFKSGEVEAIRAYYTANGYVVIRDLIPEALCDTVRLNFEQEVKPHKGYIYRQATANPEKHVFTDHGYMLNSILNLQSMDSRLFPAFQGTALNIFTHDEVQRGTRNILGEPGKLVQSMYFEGNPSTWAHQDTYYLDAEEIGKMTAAWFALEDIAPGAGRFFVYPKSHLIDIRKNGGDFNIAFNHDRYKKLVVDVIRSHNLECHAPALRKGDVLFWNSKTIHGSLSTAQPEFSRSSLTAHFIPQSSRFLQHQTRIKNLRIRTINEMQISLPKDQNIRLNRFILGIETSYPKSFQFLKKLLVKTLSGS